MTLTCPHCTHLLEAAEFMQGKLMSCPSCSKAFTVGWLPKEPVTIPVATPARVAIKGVGGWLLVFYALIAVVGPLLTFYTMTWPDFSEAVYKKLPVLKEAIIFENVVLGGIAIYGFIASWIIFNDDSKGRTLVQNYLRVRVFGIIGTELIMFMLLQELHALAFNAVIKAGTFIICREAVFFFAWWFYFKRSVRVLNTYGPVFATS